MFSIAYTLCMLFSLWASILCHSFVAVGPCVGETEKATFDCSTRSLTSLPCQIWRNVTELDLSENHLNILRTKALEKLGQYDHLIKLNLSGNYLPLLVKKSIYHFPSLEILDLSGCKLTAIEPGVLLSFPKLQKLFLGSNDLQTPLSAVLQGHGWVEVVDQTSNFQARDRTEQVVKAGARVCRKKRDSDDEHITVLPSLFQNELLSTTNQTLTTITSDPPASSKDPSLKRPSDSWKYLVAVLVIAVTLSILIAIGAKCKLLHRYLASYRHSRLSEADSASQCDPANVEVGFSSRSNISHSDTVTRNMEDDDGFIEDNYIQASERERAAQEAEHWPEEEDDEDLEEFSIA